MRQRRAYTPPRASRSAWLRRERQLLQHRVGGRLALDRAALRAALTATQGFQGITGVLSCDAFGDCGSGRINIYDHQDSGITDAAQLPVVYRFAP